MKKNIQTCGNYKFFFQKNKLLSELKVVVLHLVFTTLGDDRF